MKSECVKTERLAGYIGGTLSDKERDEVEQHLADCDDCRENFIIANMLLGDKELSEAEPLIKEKEAESLWEKFRRKITDIGTKIDEIEDNVYEWITKPISELALQPGFAQVRSSTGASVAYVRLSRKIDDLKAELYVEKVKDDKVCIDVRVFRGKEQAKNVRLTFIREGGGITSRLITGEYESFDNLGFGVYKMLLAQNSQKKGNLDFEINETGIHAK